MGCYNAVLVKCKKCGKNVEFQCSEGRECIRYDLDDYIPFSVLEEFLGESEDCLYCGESTDFPSLFLRVGDNE